jgi:hypothetical protein
MGRRARKAARKAAKRAEIIPLEPETQLETKTRVAAPDGGSVEVLEGPGRVRRRRRAAKGSTAPEDFPPTGPTGTLDRTGASGVAAAPKARRRRKATAAEVTPSARLKALPAAQLEPSARERKAEAAKARRRAARRPAMFAGVIVIAVLCALVAVSGLLVASSMKPNVVNLSSPLQIYPVTQSTPGACLPGTQGVTGPGPFCHQVTEGVAIHRLSSIQEQHDRSPWAGASCSW